MEIVTNKNENNLSMMLSIVKISIIVFISIAIYINLPKYWFDLNISFNGEFNLYTTGFFLCITGVCYLIWLIINREMLTQSSNKFRISWLLENIFYIAIISLPIYSFTAYESEYKFIFLLLIISSVIQYGSKYGIITSLITSIFSLGVDLLYAPLTDGINTYFQRDLIMTGIFIFVAWILGYYVDMEDENNKKKDETLNILCNELEKKDKQRENMESVLLKNKICYDMLFENSVNSIIVHKDGIIIYANESAAKLLGYENPMKLNGKIFYNHYSEDIKLNIKKRYLNISNNELSKIIEENILNCNGNFIPVRNTSSFFTYKGEPSVLTFLIDITSEKKVETLEKDAEENLKLLNQTREFNILIMNFFTNMSHELKTPVNVIYAAIQTIDMYLDNYKIDNINKCKSYLKTIKQNCMRMIRLINNLLDITKLDSGFIKLNKKNGDIVSIVEDIVQSVASYVKSKGIELIFDTDIEEKIMGFDHDMIERIMLNLVSNAFKYSHSNGRIYVNLIEEESNVVIKVKDEGDGIPKNKLDVIFERFGQANSSLSRQCEGTGIGLHLVKSFTEMHGGKISVISNEGKGSEFSIVLPTTLVKNEEYIDKVLFETNVERIEIEFSDIYSTRD